LLPGLSQAFATIRASGKRLHVHDTGSLTVTASP